MEKKSIAKELSSNSYPGRGIVIGKSPNGKLYWVDDMDFIVKSDRSHVVL